MTRAFLDKELEPYNIDFEVDQTKRRRQMYLRKAMEVWRTWWSETQRTPSSSHSNPFVDIVIRGKAVSLLIAWRAGHVPEDLMNEFVSKGVTIEVLENVVGEGSDGRMKQNAIAKAERASTARRRAPEATAAKVA